MSVSQNDEIFTTWTNDLEGTSALLFCLCGELDASSVPTFLADAQKVIERGRDVVADVHLLEYVDSTGLASILSTKNALAGSGLKMHLVGCHGLLAKILAITRVDAELQCYDDMESAIADIKPADDRS